MKRLLVLFCFLFAAFRGLGQPIAPTKPDSMLRVTDSSCKWAKLTWRNGNGSNHLVVLADDPNGTTAPFQGTMYYGNEFFMVGSYIQNGGFAMYSGTGNSVTLRRLQEGHTYRALVYGYNVDAQGQVAINLSRVPDTLKFTTPTCPNVTPLVPASNLRATTIDCSTFRITCHPGNGQRRLFVIRKHSRAASQSSGDVSVDNGSQYFATNVYARGLPINPGLYGIYDGTDSTVVVYGLAPDQIYKLAVYEYNTVPGPDGFPDGVTPYYNRPPFSNAPIFFPATGNCLGYEPFKSVVDDQQHQTSNARVVNGSLTSNSVSLMWHPSMTPAHVAFQGGSPVMVPAGRSSDDGVGNYVVIRNAFAFNSLPLPLQNTVPAVVSSVYGKGSPVRPGQDSIYSVKLTQAWDDTTATITGLRPSTGYVADIFTFRYPDSGSGGGTAPYTYFLSAPQASVSFFTAAAPPQPLPVTLVSFTAQRLGAQVELKWRTASEHDNAGFDVERSSDGVVWTKIGNVPGNGTTALAHDYAQRTPYVGAAYYRLRQLDTTGLGTYSPVRAVDGSLSDSKLAVYPNPSTGDISFSGADVAQPMQLLNALGQVLVELPAGTLQASLRQRLPPGVYFVRQGAQHTRLVLR